ncbi:MAG: DnaA/Hda family protein [Rhodospirillaceae bacterium]
MAPQQIPLELGHRPALGRADFLITEANREAVSWIDSWPNWPAPVVGLHGPSGCGKSHLAAVFSAKANAYFLNVDEIENANPLSLVKAHAALVWDGAEAIVNEPSLFHLFNAVRELGKHFLIVGLTPPSRWPVKLPDLKSRLAGMPLVAMQAPDDATMSAVLIKVFRDRQVDVGPDVIEFVHKRIPRTFSAILTFVDFIDRESLAKNRKISVPFVREVLNTKAIDFDQE